MCDPGPSTLLTRGSGGPEGGGEGKQVAEKPEHLCHVLKPPPPPKHPPPSSLCCVSFWHVLSPPDSISTRPHSHAPGVPSNPLLHPKLLATYPAGSLPDSLTCSHSLSFPLSPFLSFPREPSLRRQAPCPMTMPQAGSSVRLGLGLGHSILPGQTRWVTMERRRGNLDSPPFVYFFIDLLTYLLNIFY